MRISGLISKSLGSDQNIQSLSSVGVFFQTVSRVLNLEFDCFKQGLFCGVVIINILLEYLWRYGNNSIWKCLNGFDLYHPLICKKIMIIFLSSDLFMLVAFCQVAFAGLLGLLPQCRNPASGQEELGSNDQVIKKLCVQERSSKARALTNQRVLKTLWFSWSMWWSLRWKQ